LIFDDYIAYVIKIEKMKSLLISLLKHSLNPVMNSLSQFPKCANPGCSALTQWSTSQQKYYSKCPFHGLSQPQQFQPQQFQSQQFQPQQFQPQQNQYQGPKCCVLNCSNTPQWSNARKKYYSMCPSHGLSNGQVNSQVNSQVNRQANGSSRNNMCEFERWIRSQYRQLSQSDINRLQPQFENELMVKYPQLNFWFDISAISNANNVSQSTVANYIYRKKGSFNDMHTKYGFNSVEQIRFANNNGDIMYDPQIQKWLHRYLQTLIP
jgi:hypothetical protein